MSATDSLFVYLNGQVQPWQNACLHISDLSVQRGYGVFDYLKVQNGKPVFLPDYLQRFRESAQLMEMEVPLPDSELESIILDLIRRNKLGLSGIKMILTGGYSPNAYDLTDPNLIILQQPLVLPGPEQLAKGIRIITHSYVREIPKAKTINYTMGIRLQKEIKAKEASEVLYEQQGVVSEFPRCNFFILTQDDVLVTPHEQVLLGVTRNKVLQLARQKYKTEERSLHLEEVYKAKEAFLTSTTKRIVPIVQVNDMQIGNGTPGPATQQLLQDLAQLEEQETTTQNA